MAAPTINNLVLQAGRCLVLADPDSDSTGVIFKVSDQGFRRLVEAPALPQDPEDTQGPAIPYNHVLFVKENTTEVIVDGVEYLAMHQDNIVGLIPD